MSHSQTILHHLARHARDQPEKTAFTFLRFGRGQDQQLNYRQLYSRTLALADVLADSLEPGDRVLLFYPPGLDFIVGFCACLHARMVAVPAYPPGAERRMGRLLAIARDAAASAALTDDPETMAERFHAHAPHLLWPKESGRAPHYSEPDQIPPERVAFLQYTSGSTGTPKGVMVTHGNIMAASLDLQQGWDHQSDSQLVTWLPTFHDMGLIYGVLQPIFGGFSCIMFAPVAFLQKPVRWLEVISRYGASHTAAPNSAYDLCVRKISSEQRAGLDLSSLRVAVNGAEPIHRQTLDGFCESFAASGFKPQTFCPGFGLAEATLKVSATAVDQEPCYLAVNRQALAEGRVQEEDADTHLVGCGVSHIGTQIRIVDPITHQPAGDDQMGEIWVSGPIVAAGYWCREQETQAVFEARCADGSGPYLRTGDLGFQRKDHLFVTGRLKDLIIVDGRNHYPGDLEHLVESHFAEVRTAASAAFAVTRNQGEAAVLVCEIERRFRKTLKPQALRDQIRSLVLKEHDLALEDVVFIRTGSIPKTSSGKIQRGACARLWRENQLEVLPQGDSNPNPASEDIHPLAVQVTPIVEGALDLKQPPHAHTPLVRYGLTSATAVAIAADLALAFGRELPQHLLYNYPTIHQLCCFLAGDPVANPVPLAASAAHNAAVAVVGTACRFPRADTPAAFWDHLSAGRHMLTEPPDRIWFHDQRPGGYLENVDHFDAQWFGVTPAEAQWMDPQHRILLETARESLADAGLDPAGSGPRSGVYVGLSGHDYERLAADHHVGPFVGSGLTAAMAANRIAHAFDLRGPCMTLDTACASGPSAVHAAVTALRSGQCDTALAGAVNLILDPGVTSDFQTAGLISPHDHCRSFRSDGDGYVRSEGCAVLVLRLLQDADSCGQPVHGIIRGIGVTQNGRAAGLTAPSGPAMAAAMNAALTDAALKPAQIDYLEAHATGTRLGDGVELEAIEQVYGQRSQPLHLAALKAQWGHMEAASGMAAILKVLLVLRFQSLPANPQTGPLHPTLTAADKLAFESAPGIERLQFAGINSFGMGGVNVHVILERGHRLSPLPVKGYFPRAETAFWFPERSRTEKPQTITPYPKDGDAEVREAWVTQYLSRRLAAVLGMDHDSLDLEKPLAQLGFESLMVMELKNRVEADLGVSIGAEHFYMAGEFQSLVEILMEAMELTEDHHTSADPDEDMDVDGMSDDEVDAMLMQLMDDDPV